MSEIVWVNIKACCRSPVSNINWFAFCGCVGTTSEAAIFPLAIKLSTVCPSHNAVAFLFAVGVLSYILVAIWPSVRSFSISSIIFPLSFVHCSIGVAILTLSMACAINEVPHIISTTWPSILALSTYLSIFPLSVVFLATWVCAYSFAMSLACFEFSLINFSINECLCASTIWISVTFNESAKELNTIHICEGSAPMFQIFLHLSFINASIRESTDARAFHLTHDKITDVRFAAWPFPLTLAVLSVLEPLAFVLAAFCRSEDTVALLAVIHVASNILVTIRPRHDALRVVHLSIPPLPLVSLAVHPDLDSEAIFLVSLVPFPLIGGFILYLLLGLLHSLCFDHLIISIIFDTTYSS